MKFSLKISPKYKLNSKIEHSYVFMWHFCVFLYIKLNQKQITILATKNIYNINDVMSFVLYTELNSTVRKRMYHSLCRTLESMYLIRFTYWCCFVFHIVRSAHDEMDNIFIWFVRCIVHAYNRKTADS